MWKPGLVMFCVCSQLGEILSIHGPHILKHILITSSQTRSQTLTESRTSSADPSLQISAKMQLSSHHFWCSLWIMSPRCPEHTTCELSCQPLWTCFKKFGTWLLAQLDAMAHRITVCSPLAALPLVPHPFDFPETWNKEPWNPSANDLHSRSSHARPCLIEQSQLWVQALNRAPASLVLWFQFLQIRRPVFFCFFSRFVSEVFWAIQTDFFQSSRREKERERERERESFPQHFPPNQGPPREDSIESRNATLQKVRSMLSPSKENHQTADSNYIKQCLSTQTVAKPQPQDEIL